MKNTWFFILAFLSGICVAQAQTEKKIATKISSITLYLDGVEISSSEDVALNKGRNLLLFEGAAPYIPLQNIRVNATGDVSVLSIDTEAYEDFEKEAEWKFKTKTDSIKLLSQRIKSFEDELNSYNTEKEMMLKNTSIAGTTNGILASELKLTADLFRSRITEINKKISELNNAVETNTELLYAITASKDKLQTEGKINKTRIKVLINSEKVSTENIQLIYLLSNGGWSPVYEISVEDLSKDVEFVYRANVYNNSGIDWTDIKLTLSTADPWQSATQPKMDTWFVDFYSANDYSYDREYQSKQLRNEGYMQNQIMSQDIQGGASNIAMSEEYDISPSISDGETDFEEIFVSDLNVEFEVSEKYSVPSDNKPYLVDVTKYSLPAKYKHFCIPKKDRDAFILASITGWEDLNLMEGEAKIFFGGSYVGKSYIYTRNVRDTLDISLGRDNKVLVTRSKLKDYSSTKLIGGKRTETYAYEMIVKNNRKSPVDIAILDQIPVSQNSEIEVVVDNLSNGQLDVVKGEVKWNYNLQPAQSEKINLAFSMKYPKNKSINVQKNTTQKRSVRKF